MRKRVIQVSTQRTCLNPKRKNDIHRECVFCNVKMHYRYGPVIQREHVLSDAKMSYPTLKHVIQREKV